MKKSIGDNLFPKTWTLEQGLALIKKSGFDGVELWLGDKPWFQMNTSDAEVRALRRKVEDTGLTVSNVANALDWDENISARDPRIRDNALHHVDRQIETAHLLSTDSTLVVAGLVTAEIPYIFNYRGTIE